MKNSKFHKHHRLSTDERPTRRMRQSQIWLSIVLPSVLGAALIGAIIWGMMSTSKAEEYKSAAKSMYSRSYSELTSELNDLEVTLSKLQVVGSKPQYVLLLDEVWRSCGTCTGLLSQIPASHIDTSDMNQFLVRVGDYARNLSTNLLHGSVISDDDMEQLRELRKTCTELAASITERYENGDYPDDILTADGYFVSASGEYEGAETRQEYPTLIYDGPFSESAEKSEPKGLKGDKVTQAEAHSKALGYIPEKCELEFSSDSDGDIPSYDFSGKFTDGRQVDISISKKGGSLVWFMAQTTSKLSGVPEKSVVNTYESAALEYLEDHGYDDMKSTYAQYYDGIAVINFAATDGNIILYNDLVKVWVDRDTLQIIGLDARNYLYSHVDRNIKKPEITRADARLLVSENLDIKQVRLALIPATPETEVLCYEFKGECDGEDFIVYINAWNGEEQQIFRIINTEDGDLVL